MTPLTKLLAAAVLSGAALVGSASAQYPGRSLTLPPGVRPVPTLSPTVPSIAPGGCVVPPPRPYPLPSYPNPGPFPPSPGIDIDYKVFYRTSPWDRWRYYDTVDTGREARRIERYLEAQGYQVSLVEKFDRSPDR